MKAVLISLFFILAIWLSYNISDYLSDYTSDYNTHTPPNYTEKTVTVDLISRDYYCYRDFSLATDMALSFSTYKHLSRDFVMKEVEKIKKSCRNFLDNKLPHLSSDQTRILYQTFKKDKKHLKKRGVYYFTTSEIDLLFNKGKY